MDQTGSQLGYRWEGKASTSVTKASVEQIWPRFVDFFNLHNSQAAQVTPVRIAPINWSKERLISVDPLGRRLSYEMVNSNIRFTSYASMVKVISGNGDGEGRCRIEWLFAVDLAEGCVLEDLVRKFEVGLQGDGFNW
ncbi:hypothetical protein EUGRSUZ_L01247 [Eucalyptus grandis]|uniref:Bet v I/Major latex protein domain-containing protein n=1 Tax=Eucalyptus grandis TaxID=71139 RepID=A0A058ZTK9_EUCGR|nr:hypothetical protein EUGRSUZ_L01247 [Eucalyptus grandis]